MKVWNLQLRLKLTPTWSAEFRFLEAIEEILKELKRDNEIESYEIKDRLYGGRVLRSDFSLYTDIQRSKEKANQDEG